MSLQVDVKADKAGEFAANGSKYRLTSTSSLNIFPASRSEGTSRGRHISTLNSLSMGAGRDGI